MNSVDSRFLTELQLQFLTDQVAEALGEKHKYIAELSGRRQNAVAKVWNWLFLRTTQRIIEVGNHQTYGWFPLIAVNPYPHAISTEPSQATLTSRKRLIKLIVHEISHFKTKERMRNHIKRVGRIGYKRHRHHNKRFYQVFNRMLEKIKPHLDRLANLDLTQIQPSPPKPKPAKTEVYSKKLVDVQEHIKYLQTRKKRLETAIKKWRKREKYIQKNLQKAVWKQADAVYSGIKQIGGKHGTTT